MTGLEEMSMAFTMIYKLRLDINTKGRLAREFMNVKENQMLRESDWWDLDMVLLTKRVLEEEVMELLTMERDIPMNTRTLQNMQ